ncbi:hypothetical protein K431DRAFT_234990, partial [Polychaeton citri CBS 116435]
APSPMFLILTASVAVSSPSLIKLFRLPPRFVAVALPPKHIVNAVSTALFPDPLWPIMKFINGPNLMRKRE